MNPADTLLMKMLWTVIACEIYQPANPLHATLVRETMAKFDDPEAALETALLVTLNEYADLLIQSRGSKAQARRHAELMLFKLEGPDSIGGDE